MVSATVARSPASAWRRQGGGERGGGDDGGEATCEGMGASEPSVPRLDPVPVDPWLDTMIPWFEPEDAKAAARGAGGDAGGPQCTRLEPQ